jgi:hypothetical protein
MSTSRYIPNGTTKQERSKAQTRIHRAKHDRDHSYTPISNTLIDDKTISPLTFAYLAKLLRKVDHWQLHRHQFRRELGISDRQERKILKEAEDARYIRRGHRVGNADGTLGPVEYEIFEDPTQESPVKSALQPRVQNERVVPDAAAQTLQLSDDEETSVESAFSPHVQKPQGGKRTHIVNTDVEQRLNQQKEDSVVLGCDDDSHASRPSQNFRSSVNPAPKEQERRGAAVAAAPAGRAADPEPDMEAVLAEARRLVAGDHDADGIVERLEAAAAEDGSAQWAARVVREVAGPKVTSRPGLMNSKIAKHLARVRRERNHALGVYEPGEQIKAPDGVTYRANENGLLPFAARQAMGLIDWTGERARQALAERQAAHHRRYTANSGFGELPYDNAGNYTRSNGRWDPGCDECVALTR